MTYYTTYTFSSSSSSFTPPPPPKPKYSGTLLPAVIEVFDHEVNLEQLGVQQLEYVALELERTGTKLKVDGNSACTSLEPKFRGEVRKIERMQAHLRSLQIRIEAAKVKEQAAKPDVLPDPDDEDMPEEPASAKPIIPEAPTSNSTDDEEDLIGEATRSAQQARALRREQERFKKASSRAKALHRKIMMLTHEERIGKNPHLRELFDLANSARSDNNIRALEALLKMAQAYNSKQGKLTLLNYLRQKRQALKQHASALKRAIREIKESPPYQVHWLQTQNRPAEAEDLFRRLLEHSAAATQDAIQQAEFELSGLTGRFSDGSTTNQFTL